VKARWSEVARAAAARRGWTVVAEDGMDDYSGSGVLLLEAEDRARWATLVWFFGSCAGCDQYEDMNEEQRVDAFCELVVCHVTEEAARREYDGAREAFW